MGGAILLVYVSGRLRMPILFPVAVLAGSGIASGWELLRNRSAWTGKSLVLTVLLLFMGMLMSWGDWWGVRSEQVAHHDLARLSGAAWRASQYELALAYVLRVEEISPEYPRIPMLKAQALFSLDHIEESEAYFLLALQQQPGDPAPAFNLGFIAYEIHEDPRRALPFFQETLRRNPGHELSRSYLALCYLRIGDIAAAAETIQPLRHTPSTPALQTRIAVYAVLQAQGKEEEALEYHAQWISTLAPEIITMVQSHINLIEQIR